MEEKTYKDMGGSGALGMTLGIMPVTGIPLPFMSYGVSSLTTNILSVAILLNIQLRKQKLLF